MGCGRQLVRICRIVCAGKGSGPKADKAGAKFGCSLVPTALCSSYIYWTDNEQRGIAPRHHRSDSPPPLSSLSRIPNTTHSRLDLKTSCPRHPPLPSSPRAPPPPTRLADSTKTHGTNTTCTPRSARRRAPTRARSPRRGESRCSSAFCGCCRGIGHGR